MRLSTFVLVTGAVLAGCKSGTAVLVTVSASPSLSPVARLQATAIAGGQTKQFDVPLSHTTLPPAVSFAIDVPPSVQGTLNVKVDAVGAQSTTLASATGSTSLAAGQRENITITLETVVAGDMATPTPNSVDGSAEMGSDLATADDLNKSPGDLSRLPDLSPPPPPCALVTVTTLSGNGTIGFFDGSGGPTGTAQFRYPMGISTDGTNILVADSGNNRIRNVDPLNGSVSTLAGNGVAGSTASEMNNPQGVVIINGNMYVADTGNNKIRSIMVPGGMLNPLAGTGVAGFQDDPNATGGAQFNSPSGITADGSGHIYIADTQNNRIRTVYLSGATTTLSGNGVVERSDGSGGANGTASFFAPQGVAVDNMGNVYVADTQNNCIRKIAPNGATTTLAGDCVDGSLTDGTGGRLGTARFAQPMAVALDGNNNLYVADQTNNAIRRVAPDGTTVTIAGNSGKAGFKDASGCDAQFNGPSGITVNGTILYVADTKNSRIRQLQLH